MTADPFEHILAGTAAHTGSEFFRSLVENLASVLGTRGAWVTEYLENERKLRALAFWFDSGFVDKYEYAIDGTPCEMVIESKKLFHIPDNLIELFPKDSDLVSMNGVSYMGAPLLDADGTILGHLSVLHDKYLPREKRLVTLFNIFAARAASELRRIRKEEAVKEREVKLTRLIDSAMDAIIEFRPDLGITRYNASFKQIFRCADENPGGHFLPRFLDGESVKKLQSLMSELPARPEGNRYMWIPGGLKAICGKGDTFEAEATLSFYSLNGERFFSLILRNVTDRIKAERRIDALQAETAYLREELRATQQFDDIIGRSGALMRVLKDVEQVAPTDASVLIYGETGTGKELIARAVHGYSKRRDQALIKVNCAAIPASLIESEFFGHEKGAFTGATAKRSGRFSLADGGSIFLDEIGELSLDVQSKLLRVLQEGEFDPVGSSSTAKVDVRIIAATNRDLLAMSREGKFREDLYYRLNVFPIHLPPLRERTEDIADLAGMFVQKCARKTGRRIPVLTNDDINRLTGYDWPGNIRELQNVMERAFITGTDGRINLDRALPETPAGSTAPKTVQNGIPGHTVRTAREMEEAERQNLILALTSSNWKISGSGGAADLLGIPPTTLSSRMKTLGIRKP
jgi:PAS domain S-box-containing protein